MAEDVELAEVWEPVLKPVTVPLSAEADIIFPSVAVVLLPVDAKVLVVKVVATVDSLRHMCEISRSSSQAQCPGTSTSVGPYIHDNSPFSPTAVLG